MISTEYIYSIGRKNLIVFHPVIHHAPMWIAILICILTFKEIRGLMILLIYVITCAHCSYKLMGTGRWSLQMLHIAKYWKNEGPCKPDTTQYKMTHITGANCDATCCSPDQQKIAFYSECRNGQFTCKWWVIWYYIFVGKGCRGNVIPKAWVDDRCIQ